jgi:hypothetical protein
MGIFGSGKKDPAGGSRDPVGNNPTGRERKSSAGRRRKADAKTEKDLGGSKWGKKKS